jgi:hypothetical protein
MSGIVNLKQYDIVLTTSYEFKFGVCGHLFEMIDYYWAIKNWTDLNPCILLADGTTIEEFNLAVIQKYDSVNIDNVVYNPQPKVIMATNLLIVDGSPRLRNAELLVSNIFLFRCSESNFSYYKGKTVFLLQDNEIYDDRPSDVTIVDYKKKILFSKYKQYTSTVKDTAMFYLTSVCRALTHNELVDAIRTHGFQHNIVLTNDTSMYKLDSVYRVPVDNMWNMFSTYIYTRVPRQIDCSSRFILECMHYGKDVIYDIDYYDRALEIRKKDGLTGTVLNKDDYFLRLLNEQTQCRTNTDRLLASY